MATDSVLSSAGDPDRAGEQLEETAAAAAVPVPEEYRPDEPKPFEANPVDVAEQAVSVPIDDDERERG